MLRKFRQRQANLKTSNLKNFLRKAFTVKIIYSKSEASVEQMRVNCFFFFEAKQKKSFWNQNLHKSPKYYRKR